MLEAAKRLHTSALIPFIPRQIMLEAHSIATAQKEEKKRRKAAAVTATAEIEEKKEKRKKKKSSEILDVDSRALEVLDLDRTNGGTLQQKGKGRGILLSSIAAFLESNGFSKTLAVFQSEAQPEINGGKTSVMNLEELFCKFLESSRSDAEITIDWQKEQDSEKAGIQGNGHCENILDATDHLHSKKRKNLNIIGDGTKAVNTSGDKTVMETLVCAENSHVETKDKKKKKKLVSDSLGENTEKCHLEGSHGTENTDHAIQLSQPHVNDKEKRKKKHKECEDTVKSQELVEEKTEELKSLTHNSYTPSAESNPKHKDEKKKKTKRTSDSLYENAEQLELGASQEVINKKSKELKSSGCENTDFKLLDSATKDASIKNVMDNTDSKSKDRKKNRGKPISESLHAVSSHQLNGGSSQDGKEGHTTLGKSDSGKEKALVSVGDIDSETISKKRKRLASEEKASQAENEVVTKNSGDTKFEGAEDNKGTGTHQKQDNEYLAIGKKRKTEKSNENSTKTIKASPTEQFNGLIEHKETPSACDSPKEAEGHQLANGKPEKEEREGDTSSRAMKNGKRSVEPKTVNAFQRVKIDEVKFTNERLQDNSYWAKGGADSGYGAKAQEILGQVRGRDFRHEKTKKKRGSYRGGQIDLDSHSIKFNYSDEE